jgi:hypothetical protein
MRPILHPATLPQPQVAVDYSTTRRLWQEMIRVWAVHLRHDRYDRTLDNSLDVIRASHRRSQKVRCGPN